MLFYLLTIAEFHSEILLLTNYGSLSQWAVLGINQSLFVEKILMNNDKKELKSNFDKKIPLMLFHETIHYALPLSGPINLIISSAFRKAIFHTNKNATIPSFLSQQGVRHPR